MTSEPVREQMPEAADDVQVVLTDTHGPNLRNATTGRADPLSFDPYSPLPPTSADLAGIPAL